jgi:hypothetical protein
VIQAFIACTVRRLVYSSFARVVVYFLFYFKEEENQTWSSRNIRFDINFFCKQYINYIYTKHILKCLKRQWEYIQFLNIVYRKIWITSSIRVHIAFLLTKQKKSIENILDKTITFSSFNFLIYICLVDVHLMVFYSLFHFDTLFIGKIDIKKL